MLALLKAVPQWMSGRKTYLGAIGYGVLGIFWSEGWVSDDTAKMVAGLLTMWTGFAIRSAIGKADSPDTK